MRGWRETSLGEIAQLTVGPAFKSARFTEDPADTRLLRGINVGVGGLRWHSTKRWPCSDSQQYDKYLLRSGDGIVAMDRPWIDAGLKVAVATEADVPSLLVQRVARLRAAAGVEQGFIVALIRSPDFSAYIRGATSGTAVPHISAADIQGFPCALPSVATQRRLAAVLAAFDELITINERRIELLEDLARLLYREWIQRAGHPSVNGRRENLPTGWHWRRASEVFTVNPRIRASQPSFPRITMGDVDERFAAAFPSDSVTRPSGSRFQRDDVLLARITPSLENGKTALVKSLDPGVIGVGSTEFIVLRGGTVGPAFTYCAARSDELRQHAIKSMSGASGRQRVAANAFETLSLVEPPAAVVAEFEKSAGALLEAGFALAAQNRALVHARDLLLPRLVTGRLDISDVDLGDLLPSEPSA